MLAKSSRELLQVLRSQEGNSSKKLLNGTNRNNRIQTELHRVTTRLSATFLRHQKQWTISQKVF